MNSKYLSSTSIIDSDHEKIKAYAKASIGDAVDQIEKAVRLYYSVRDDIWYDPYYPFYLPEHYRASNVLKSGRGYCVCKASLLCAVGRASSIPTRLGFADVRNHLATRELLEYLGNDLFVFHGFVEFHLEGRWVKATPAFNKELCERHGVLPLEFNGREDSIFQPYNLKNEQFMEYVTDHGTFSDIPLEKILEGWRRAYGKERVNSWIRMFERTGDAPVRDFSKEEVCRKN